MEHIEGPESAIRSRGHQVSTVKRTFTGADDLFGFTPPAGSPDDGGPCITHRVMPALAGAVSAGVHMVAMLAKSSRAGSVRWPRVCTSNAARAQRQEVQCELQKQDEKDPWGDECQGWQCTMPKLHGCAMPGTHHLGPRG